MAVKCKDRDIRNSVTSLSDQQLADVLNTISDEELPDHIGFRFAIQEAADRLEAADD